MILQCTYQVNRIEVGTLFEHRFLCRIFQVDLRTFQDLRRDSAIRILCQERTATRFAYILHHTANTQRTEQFALDIENQFGIFQQLRIRILDTQVIL